MKNSKESKASPEDKHLLQMYVSRILKSQLDYLETQLAGVQFSNDIEFVHHTRVMSRRLRTSVETFSAFLGKKALHNWLPALRKLTKSLTSTRDLDIQIQFLEKETEKLESHILRPGINRLLLRKRQKRASAAGQVRNNVDSFLQSGTVSSIREFIDNHPYHADIFTPTQTLSSLAAEDVESKIKDCFSHAPFITNPANIEQIHALRISMKHLRYSVELFQPLYPVLSEYLEVFKQFQDHLGHIHDCDVWLDELAKFSTAEYKRIVKFYGQGGPFNFIKPGIEYLTAGISDSRIAAYERFMRYWNEQFQGQFWSGLREQFIPFPVYQPADPQREQSPES